MDIYRFDREIAPRAGIYKSLGRVDAVAPVARQDVPRIAEALLRLYRVPELQRERELRDLRQKIDAVYPTNSSTPAEGSMFPFRINNKPAAIIVQRDQGSPVRNTFVAAHERTHVAQYFGLTAWLQAEWAKQNVHIDLAPYQRLTRNTPADNEIIAHIGGLVALKARGLPLETHLLAQLSTYQNTDLYRAWALAIRAQGDEKRYNPLKF
jgi:hypothetical protein